MIVIHALIEGFLEKENLQVSSLVGFAKTFTHYLGPIITHFHPLPPTLVPLRGVFESHGPPPLSVVTTTTVLSIRPRCFRSTNTWNARKHQISSRHIMK